MSDDADATTPDTGRSAPGTSGSTDPVGDNRRYWDSRAAAHAASPEYAVDRFAADPTFVSDVVRFDRPRLGDLSGQRGVHLQCHIGTDTVSLTRLGARMTGLDLSGASLAEARRIAAMAGADIDFVEGPVDAALDLLPHGAFDLVYTGIGALCWLPDIRAWARTVATLLAPGGRLFVREGHPVLWAMEWDREDDLLVMSTPYFETADPIRDDEEGTYVTTDAPIDVTVSFSWNHGLGEIVTAVLEAGLVISGLEEHRTVPWNGLPPAMEKVEFGVFGEYALRRDRDRAPLTYTLQARKPR